MIKEQFDLWQLGNGPTLESTSLAYKFKHGKDLVEPKELSSC
jgi:hypothetical protein